jgi:hypothetical protein
MSAGRELTPSLEIYINDLGQDVKGICLVSFGHLARLADGEDVVHRESRWQNKVEKIQKKVA